MKQIIDSLTIIVLIMTILGGLRAYMKYVIEKGTLPAVEPSLEINLLGELDGKRLIEVQLNLKNLGATILVASNMYLKFHTLTKEDKCEVVGSVDNLANERLSVSENLLGRVFFPNKLEVILDGTKGSQKLLTENLHSNTLLTSSKIPILSHDTIVFPKVSQAYTLVTAVPKAVEYILIKGFFYYKKPNFWQKAMINIGYWLGIVKHRMKYITKPHTIERAFRVG